MAARGAAGRARRSFPKVTSVNGGLEIGISARSDCAECRSKDDMITFLRQELTRLTEDRRRLEQTNDNLTNKIVLFSERAADHEHRLKMTQLAHMKPLPMEGMAPRDELMTDEMGQAADQLMEQILGRSQ